MSLQDKIAQFSADSDTLNRIVHGGPTTVVPTTGGNVRSLAKLIADGQALIDALVAAGGGTGGPATSLAWGKLTGPLANQADLVAALGSKQNTLPAGDITQYLRGDKTLATLNAAAVGLGAVNNTSDAAKPVSTAQAQALALKAPLASPALTGTPTAPTAAVGTNTDQIATMKAIQEAVAAVLGGTGGAAIWGSIGGVLGNQADLKAALDGKQASLPVGTSIQYLRGDLTMANLDKAALGLPNVDNTSDASKPVSTAQAAALALKADKTSMNPAGVGLGNVNNTSDADKPVSTAQAAALAAKAPLTSPALGGIPTAPTAALGTDTDQIATMRAIKAAVAAGGGSGGLANPMNAAGDVIVGGTSGAPTRLGKGSSNFVLTIDATSGLPTWKAATGGAASNASQVTIDMTAGPARTLQDYVRLAVMKTPWDFGAIGTSQNANNPMSNRYATLADAQAAFPNVFGLKLSDQIDYVALQALQTWMEVNRKPVNYGGGSFCINREIRCYGYCDIYGRGARIGMQRMETGRIDGTTPIANNLNFPMRDDPAVLSGWAYYVYDPAYYMTWRDVNAYDGRGLCSFRNDPNAPHFINCTANYCNSGVIYWGGCQNPNYLNCGGAPLGVWHMSSCTAVVSGHPFGTNSDNFYSDNVRLMCEAGFNSFGITQYPAFDAFIRDSILRPAEVSTVQGSSTTYRDADGVQYPNDHEFCNPTGRMVWMPFRNVRQCMTFVMKGQDQRGTGMKRGYFLINTEVKSIRLEGNNYEELFQGQAEDATNPALGYVGSIVSGYIADQAQITYIDKKHPLVAYTRRGQNEGFPDDRGMFCLGAQQNLVKDRIGIRGYRQGVFYIGNQKFPMILNQWRDQSRQDPNAPLDAYYKVNGRTITNFEVETLMESEATVLTLPALATDGKWRNISLLRTYDPFCGFLEMQVRNCTTGEIDVGRYYVTTGQSETRTLAADLKNGDTQAVFTASPSDQYRHMRYAEWSASADGTAKGFTADRYLGGNALAVVGGKVSGLTATIPAGTVMYRNRLLFPVQEFQRGWVSIVNNTSEGIAFQGDDVIGIRNNQANWDNQDAGDTLEIIIRTSHLALASDCRYGPTPPTSGLWREGAPFKRSRGAATPVLEWNCTAGGTPGTWRATKWETRSGTTAQRPALTSSDVGVTYIDTSLGKMIVWSGSAWLV